MALSSDVIREFAKQAIGETETVSTSKEVTGTACEYNGKIYVQMDGTDQLTPIQSSTVGMKAGDRVTVLIQDHTARVTGNVTDPSSQKSTFENFSEDTNNKISEFETVIAGKVDTDSLNAANARIDALITDNVLVKEKLTATEADISTLKTDKADVTDLKAATADIDALKADSLTVSKADAKYATIENLTATNETVNNLNATYGEFKVATTEQLNANSADITNLKATALTAKSADAKYANIDFANIGELAIKNFFSKSGIIGDLVIKDGTITGTLVGVTIKGDLIDGGTVIADKLVVRGSDGLFYKLNTDGITTSAEQTEYNSLSGSVITAKSITAEKVSVSDLVAFGATIGGYHITEDALYSGDKTSATNTTRGVYMNDDGEFAVGDTANFVKFFEDTDGTYKLAISAASVMIKASSGSNVSVAEAIDSATTAANEAKSAASSATDTANAARDAASTATTTANDAKDAASTATTTASEAKTAAASATDTANAASTAASKAQSTADSATKTANTASSTASAASTAASEAKTAASNAQTTANTASSNASTALSTANTAKSTADTANTTATEAKTTAETVQGGLETTNNTLATVQDTANTANSTADSAQKALAQLVTDITEAKYVTSLELGNAISSLVSVSDSTGTTSTFMKQTEKGWVFDIASLQQSLTTAENGISGLVSKTSYISMSQDSSGNPVLELGKPNDADGFKVRISNTSLDFMQGENKVAYVSNKMLYINRSVVTDEMQLGSDVGFVWKKRPTSASTSAMGLRYTGGVNLLKNTLGAVATENNVTSASYGIVESLFQAAAGQVVTISVEISCTDLVYNRRLGTEMSFKVGSTTYYAPAIWTNEGADGSTKNTWTKRITGYTTLPAAAASVTNAMLSSANESKCYIQGYISGSVTVSLPKLELGYTATDWTPSPED